MILHQHALKRPINIIIRLFTIEIYVLLWVVASNVYYTYTILS